MMEGDFTLSQEFWYERISPGQAKWNSSYGRVWGWFYFLDVKFRKMVKHVGLSGLQAVWASTILIIMMVF